MSTVPTRKISETLLEFAEPLLSDLPDEHSRAELEAALKLATCVWNACVLDQWHKTTEHTDALRRQFPPGFEAHMALVLALVERKRRLYAYDPRGITNGEVVTRNGRFSFRAEARLDVEKVEMGGTAQ